MQSHFELRRGGPQGIQIDMCSRQLGTIDLESTEASGIEVENMNQGIKLEPWKRKSSLRENRQEELKMERSVKPTLNV